MVSSMYDDVSVNGCSTVTKLATASAITCRNMASCEELVTSLLNVLLGVKTASVTDTATACDPLYSFDTRTNAALAIATLTEERNGQTHVLAARSGGAVLQLCYLAKAKAPAEVQEFEVAYLQAYWYVTHNIFACVYLPMLYNLCSCYVTPALYPLQTSVRPKTPGCELRA